MTFVRVVSSVRDGVEINRNYKVVLLCRIDTEKKITDGEWFGYVQNENEAIIPFVLRNQNKFIYGEQYTPEATNITEKLIEVGTLFTVFSETEPTYEIESVHTF